MSQTIYRSRTLTFTSFTKNVTQFYNILVFIASLIFCKSHNLKNGMPLRFKPCLHQPCDNFFLANSYDLIRKPISGKSQRLNTIRRDRTAPYDFRKTVVRLSNGPYAIADLLIANSHGSRTNSYDSESYEFVGKLSCDCRTTRKNSYGCRTTTVRMQCVVRVSVIRTRRMRFHTFFCMLTFSKQRRLLTFTFSWRFVVYLMF